MEIIDDGFRHRRPEDESAITMLHYDGNMLQNDLKNARYAFYILIVVSMAGIAISIYQKENAVEDILLEGMIVLSAYIFAAWFVGRNPRVALCVGVGMYFLQTIVYGIIVPATLYKGLLLKIALIYYLVKGLIAAFKYEKVRASLAEYGEELTLVL